MVAAVSRTDTGLGGLAGLAGGGTPAVANKEDFLKLLVAQLSQQDPLNPQDGAEFVAQLAQFSSVEQLMNIRGGLDTLALAQQASTSAQVVGFIGRDVVALGNEIRLSGGAGEVTFSLAAGAAEVDVEVVDGTGRTVKKVPLAAGDRGAGEHSVSLVGLVGEDEQPLEGDYTFRVRARDTSGDAISATTFRRGTVTGVTFENGYPELLLSNGKRLSLAEVVRVEREQTATAVTTAPAGLTQRYAPEPAAGEDEEPTLGDPARVPPAPVPVGRPLLRDVDAFLLRQIERAGGGQ
jgi:flagellar basal-body rod modification protein FlgD